MNVSRSIPSTVTGVSFSFLSSEEIRRISVKQIVNPVLLDDLNRPNAGGLYDPALGPSDKRDICATCRLTYFTCPGHFGHIELPAPVFHPLFMVNCYNLLQGLCMFCHRFKMGNNMLVKFKAKLLLLERGLLEAAQEIDTISPEASAEVPHERDEDEDGDDLDEKSDIAFEKTIMDYVWSEVKKAPKIGRDYYKNTLVYDARKKVISEFLKATALKQCKKLGCGAHGYSLRKEKYTKIIELDLSDKQKTRNMGMKRPNVFNLHAAHSYASEKPNVMAVSMAAPEEESSTSSEGEGDDLMEVDGEENQLPRAANGRVKTARGRNERVMAPEECRAHLRLLFQNEAEMCALIFGRHGPFATLNKKGFASTTADMFFMEVVPVSPTRFRPPASMGDTLFEHPQNELLAKILQTTYKLRDLNISLKQASEKKEGFDEAARRKILGVLLEVLVQLQVDVNSFMDSGKNPTPVRQGKLLPAGVKQTLEKKEGLFRMHMMGKRVNYAARSVISPDVNIEPSEIGVPPVFARKLTFPEPVTEHNFHELRQLVINGPRNYPGASLIEYEDGRQQSLEKLTLEQRTAIANTLRTQSSHEADRHTKRKGLTTREAAIPKKVYRHLRDGDILILNRQPTLHKPSMMAHRARVLQGEKTIRMHYANCNSYNADFDGDEMNIHFPQNEVARSEAMFIANTDNQYLAATSGKPLRGLIQDHVVAGVWMTSQDSFFTREEYFQLLYGALRPEDDQSMTQGRLLTLPPAIWKPVPLWTGKQIISTVLRNIVPDPNLGLNLNAEAKVPGHLWGKDSKEDKVVFLGGELLSGVLDKSAFGASDFGLVHSVYELYGAETAGCLLGVLSRLFTKYLQHRAFTCRMDDLALTAEGNERRSEILRKGANLGTEAAIENFPSLSSTPKDEIPSSLRQLLEDVLRDDSKMAGLDMTVKTKLGKLTSSISDAVMPHGLLRKFPHNHMQTMTLSGAKGSAVNARQISCALGQQELEGRRVPVMVSGKTLPSFQAFETKAMAGGYIASRFLTGVKPQEFYFHCMAGREGLIDTAVKTSRSGYLQRCLIKHLEGIHVRYDNTVRGSDNSVYQFYYGGDGLDVTKQKHLYQFEFIARNEVSLATLYKPNQIRQAINEKEAAEYMKKVLKKSNVRPEPGARSQRDKYDPALSLYNPAHYLGSTSEQFAVAVMDYFKKNPHRLLRPKKGKEEEDTRLWNSRYELVPQQRLRDLLNIKYMRSLVEPGEAVGLLASQGVGEPSTQMTLNTFHFAGHGAANVTLGIPRLREIVMTASQKPKTPSMTMKVRPDVSPEDVAAFCKRASRLTLSQVVSEVVVKERILLKGEARSTEFQVDVNFFPKAEYQVEYDITPSEILASFAIKFPLLLKKEMQLEMKRLDADLKNQIANLGKGSKSKGREGDEEDEAAEDAGDVPSRRRADDEISEVGDGDADATKRAQQKKQQVSYDEDDSEQDEDDESKPFDDEELEAQFEEEVVENDEPKVKTKLGKTLKNAVGAVEGLFQKNMPYATTFTFDEDHCSFQIEFGSQMPKLLLVGIVERTCRNTVIREIPGIQDCFQVKEDNKKGGAPEVKLTTNGSNLSGMWMFSAGSEESILEDNDIYSNDVYAILMTYGVEAARATILREMGGVFGAYNIDVDRRHLELIADYMTFEGGYKPFNRKGISTNPSPLLKASFETTASFLSDATLYGDFDDLQSPSGSIVLGRPNLTGTGAFDVLAPVAVVG